MAEAHLAAGMRTLCAAEEQTKRQPEDDEEDEDDDPGTRSDAVRLPRSRTAPTAC